MTAPFRSADREAVARMVTERVGGEDPTSADGITDVVLGPHGALVLAVSGWWEVVGAGDVLWFSTFSAGRGTRHTGRGWRERTAADIVAAITAARGETP